MKLTSLRPMLWTAQLKETCDFYTNTLGFTLGEYNEDWGWASLQRDGVDIMLARPTEHTAFDQPKFTGSFYFNTDDVNTLWDSLKDKVNVFYPMEDFEYGMREFAILDNNGYILQFGQDLETLKS